MVKKETEAMKRVRILLRVSSHQQLEADGDLKVQRQIILDFIYQHKDWKFDGKEYFTLFYVAVHIWRNGDYMRNIQEKICTLILAVLAGGAIGIGGCVFLSLDDKVIGALIFTIGLYAICLHGLNLYTGKVGYLVNQPLPYCLDLVIIWVGNLAGTFLAAVGMQATRIASISEKAAEMCKIKLNDSLMSVFVLGIFCGFLMFVAVDGYRSTKNPVILFMGVTMKIL